MCVLISGAVSVLDFSSFPNTVAINCLQTLLLKKMLLLSYCSEESQLNSVDVSDYNCSDKTFWFHCFVK